jgi:tetratricopeptide (TPR) repeat protein
LTAALAHAGSLPEREQTLIRAHVLEWRGDRAAAVSLLAPLLVQRPDDVEALDAIAYDDFRLHRYQEAVDAYRRVLAIDSMDASAWLNRAESESDLGRHADAMHSFGRAFAIEPALLTANDNLNLEYATALVRAGRRDSAQAVIELLAAQPDPLRRARAQRSMAFLAEFDGRYADAARRLTEAVALSRTTGSTISEVRNRVLLATALTELGRRRDASNQLDSAFAMADSVAGEPTMVFWLGKALARAGKLRYASRLVSVLESQPATGSTYRAMLESLRAEVLLGERKPAEAVERAQVATQVDSSAAVVETLAVALEASGALDRAAERYAWLAVHAPKFGFEGQHESQFAAFWLAHVREHAGNGQAARDAYEDFLIRWPPASSADLPAVAEARRRLERLAPAEPRR